MKRLREEFAPRKPEVPQITIAMPSPSRYDALLSGEHEDEPEEVPA